MLSHVAVSFGPAMQHAPRATLGMGMRAHSLPCGKVPSVTNVPLTGCTLLLRSTRECSSRTKESWWAWKHASVRCCAAGQSRYEYCHAHLESEAGTAVGLS